MSKNKVAILFFLATLGGYALTVFFLPDLDLWIPSYVYHIVILIFPLILMVFHQETTISLGLSPGKWKIGIPAALAVIIISWLVYWIPVKRFFPPTVDHIFFSTIVWGPAAEEFLFRSYMQPKLESLMKRWPGLVATSLLFGIAHLPKIYLRGAAAPLLVPGAFILGFVFGVIRDRTGSVYYGMLCHMAYNLIVTVVYIMCQ